MQTQKGFRRTVASGACDCRNAAVVTSPNPDLGAAGTTATVALVRKLVRRSQALEAQADDQCAFYNIADNMSIKNFRIEGIHALYRWHGLSMLILLHI